MSPHGSPSVPLPCWRARHPPEVFDDQFRGPRRSTGQRVHHLASSLCDELPATVSLAVQYTAKLVAGRRGQGPHGAPLSAGRQAIANRGSPRAIAPGDVRPARAFAHPRQMDSVNRLRSAHLPKHGQLPVVQLGTRHGAMGVPTLLVLSAGGVLTEQGRHEGQPNRAELRLRVEHRNPRFSGQVSPAVGILPNRADGVSKLALSEVRSRRCSLRIRRARRESALVVSSGYHDELPLRCAPGFR